MDTYFHPYPTIFFTISFNSPSHMQKELLAGNGKEINTLVKSEAELAESTQV